MGVFFERVPTGAEKTVRDVVAEALRTDPNAVGNVEDDAKDRAAEVAPAGYTTFNAGRFIGALVLWGLVVAGGIATEAFDLDKSSDALWAASAIVFGVVVGFLAGEKSAS